jgi:hypothetical protein
MEERPEVVESSYSDGGISSTRNSSRPAKSSFKGAAFNQSVAHRSRSNSPAVSNARSDDGDESSDGSARGRGRPKGGRGNQFSSHAGKVMSAANASRSRLHQQAGVHVGPILKAQVVRFLSGLPGNGLHVAWFNAQPF